MKNNKKQIKSNKYWIMLLTILIVIFSFGFSTFFSINSLSYLISDKQKEDAVIYTSNINKDISSIMAKPVGVSLGMNNEMIRSVINNIDDYSDDDLSEIFGNYLSKLILEFDYDTAFIAPDRNHIYYTEYGASKVIDIFNSDDDWYERFKNTNQHYEMNIDNDQVNDNRATMYINCRLENDYGNFIGACGIGICVDSITNILSEYETLDGYTIMLVSGDGKIQISGDKVPDYNEEENTLEFNYISEKYESGIKNYDKKNSYEVVNCDKKEFYVISYNEECGWYLIIDFNGKELSRYSDVILQNIIACVIALVIVLILVRFVISYLENKSTKFKIESEIDELTGLYNRRVYEEDIHNYDKNGIPDNFVFISIDVNELKVVNDTLGHEAGDEIISGAASCMSKCFDPYGKVYRTGGDEFVVFIEIEKNEFLKVIKDFEDGISAWSGKLVNSLAVSTGYVCKTEVNNPTIKSLSSIAEERMYKSKSLYYMKKGTDRRGQRDAHTALCKLYTKILKINITEDVFIVVNMNEDERISEKGFSDKISLWLKGFAESGQVHPEDVKDYLCKTDMEYMREYFRNNSKSLMIIYRRRIGEEFKRVLMEIIPANDYSDDSQSLYLYVKDIDIS